MIKLLGRNIIRLIVLVMVQILIVNNIQINEYFLPQFYILFILLLPFETPRWLLLVSAFTLGISVDLFTQTPGMHAAASVFMAFLRPWILEMSAPRDGYETGTFPRLYYYGFQWFLRYTVILVLAHHFVLFYIEIFRFTEFFSTLLRVLLSSLFSIILIMLSQYFIFRK
ncbi:MAG TPA: rod shape-determining protein MreD [Bacteroides sp.]|nr:rod shape-determining protein MreD [Bacteroides sp.]